MYDRKRNFVVLYSSFSYMLSVIPLRTVLFVVVVAVLHPHQWMEMTAGRRESREHICIGAYKNNADVLNWAVFFGCR
jgi:hypothetical protein